MLARNAGQHAGRVRGLHGRHAPMQPTQPPSQTRECRGRSASAGVATGEAQGRRKSPCRCTEPGKPELTKKKRVIRYQTGSQQLERDRCTSFRLVSRFCFYSYEKTFNHAMCLPKKPDCKRF